MNPDQVIEGLKLKGVNITRRTLLRYETAKLIPEPVRGGKGRGRGRVTEYPVDTVERAHLVYRLLHGEPRYSVKALTLLRDKLLKTKDDLDRIVSIQID